MVETILAVPYNFILFKFDNTDERDKFLENTNCQRALKKKWIIWIFSYLLKELNLKLKTFPTNKTLDGDGYTECATEHLVIPYNF